MIAALLAAPVVQGVVGQVVSQFAPHPIAPRFNPYIQNLDIAPRAPANVSSPSGTLQSSQWGQLGNSDLQGWLKGLVGRHVDAVDASGRTISGVLSAAQPLGGGNALTIGGHVISLSQLKQITWSPSVA